MTAEVRCAECGYVDEVGSPLGLAPTLDIVEAVCERAACPRCDLMAMVPLSPPASAVPSSGGRG